jgi:hypothetical protein
MPYRYTNTDKWSDSWFNKLNQSEKLLFLYLCDNCNYAGFIDVILNKWAFDTGIDLKKIVTVLAGIEKAVLYSNDKSVLYLRTFLKHQKNFPLNETNKSHLGILKKFSEIAYKFDIHDVNAFIEENIKGLTEGAYISPTGIGNGIGNGIGGVTQPQEGELKPLVKTDPLFTQNVCAKISKIQEPFSISEYWEKWLRYKKDQFKFTFKSVESEKTAVKSLQKLSEGKTKLAEQIIDRSIANGWQGLFEPEVKKVDPYAGLPEPARPGAVAKVTPVSPESLAKLEARQKQWCEALVADTPEEFIKIKESQITNE